MKYISLLLVLFSLSCSNTKQLPKRSASLNQPITLVIHGGAGTLNTKTVNAQAQAAYLEILKVVLDTGYAILERGGTSADAVIAAITLMEDSPLFNAGKGAVFTDKGTIELDASIMDGSTLKAGAVAGVTTIKNPITAAYAVMTKSEHVLLIGKGAEEFASEQNVELVEPVYFVDSMRYKQWQKRKQKPKVGQRAVELNDYKFGTVGAVALDKYGNIVAGTSTGGMSGKKYGRVGDSPILGAGTYADNKTCGISATGWGEYFIRLAVAHDISALMQYKNASLQEAAEKVIMEKLPKLGGDGGVIGLDAKGNVAMVFNTDGMLRGYIQKRGLAQVFIFKD